MLLRRLITLAILVYATLWLSYWYQKRKIHVARPAHVAAYVDQFGSLAAELGEMTGVPPAIILAVGGLESGWGSSELAREGGNHFGIKIRRSDDPSYCLPTLEYIKSRRKNIRACFRAYEHPDDSFRDYALLLASTPRYQELFRFNTFDYEEWAHGLQRIGYATDPRYADKIIRVVQQYGLYLE